MQGEHDQEGKQRGRRRSEGIPIDYERRFLALLEEMEEATRAHFTVSIRQAGSDHKLTLKPFDQREQYSVFEMKERYAALNGLYPSMDALNQTILKLKYGASLQPGHTIWLCPACGKGEKEWEEAAPYETERSNRASTSIFDICQFCNHQLPSLWNDIGFCLDSGTVYTGNTRSIFIRESIGKITIVK